VTGPATYAGPTVVNAGTLQVAGPGALPLATVLTVAAGATLDGGGQALSLGSLDGGGSVLIGNGSLSVGTNNLSSGQFGAIDAPGPFDSFFVVRGSMALAILERTDIPLASLATTENGRAAGAALDVARRTASADLRTVIREVMGLSDPNVSGALAQLGGSVAATALRTGALDAENVIRSVSDRLIDLRTGVRSDLTRSTVGAAGLSTGVWFRASGGGISGGAINSNLRLQGGLLGVDRQLAGGRWSVGAFGGYDRAVLDVDAGMNTIRDRRYRIGAYATTTVGPAYLDTAVAGASHRFETTRHLAFVAQLDPQFGGGPLFGGIDRSAAARYAGHDVTSFIESGVSRTLGQVFLQPFVGLDASRVSSDGFSESGSGSIDLVVADATTASLRAAVGLRAGRGFTASNGRLFAPRAELRYLHELLSPMATMQGAFADASSIPFAIQSSEYGRHAVSVSAGFVASIGRGLMLSLDYRGVFAPTDRTHAVTFGVAF
jgi:outer membrane autotransporter protein